MPFLAERGENSSVFRRFAASSRLGFPWEGPRRRRQRLKYVSGVPLFLEVTEEMTTRPAAITCALAALLSLSFPGTAGATGTMSIHHQSGTTNTYSDVDIRVFSGALFLTSEDGDGTIVVTRAACSYQGKIIVCLPTAAVLVQGGQSNALNLKTGTIYLNYTDAAQQLSNSSAKLPPNSVMLAISTRNGTVINLHGRLDEVIKQ